MSQINTAVHLDVDRRHEFVLLFDVLRGNPNGDPDAENLPRFNPRTGRGLVSDVAIKRKVRDYVTKYKATPIFIQSQVALNRLILDAFLTAGIQPLEAEVTDEELYDWLSENVPQEAGFTLDGDKLLYAGDSNREQDIRNALLEGIDNTAEARDLRQKLTRLARDIARSGGRGQRAVTREVRAKAREVLFETYYDIRMFGAVLSTGLNAGQVRGPMQLIFAESQDPIDTADYTLTRNARTTSARMLTGPTEIGRKSLVPYGLYRTHGFFNPFFAEDTKVTRDDLALFWEALENAWDLDRSAARGEMACRGLYVFSHKSKLGNAHAHELFKLIQVEKRDDVESPESFEDYEVKAPDPGSLDAHDFPEVTLTRLVPKPTRLVG